MGNKKNLTIRIDDELREQLQLISDREMRPLANQIIFFLTKATSGYLDNNGLIYVPEAGKLMTEEEYRLYEDGKCDIPF